MSFIGRASNEAFELIVGNILIAFGGVILGFLYPLPEYQVWSYASAAFFGAGIIFDVRVLSKFAYELRGVKDDINTARREIQGVTAALKHQEKISNAASERLDIAAREIEKQKEELKEMAEKTFSRFSSHARSTPVEEMVEKTFEKLDERLRRVEEKLGTSSTWNRLRGSHRPY